MSAIKEDAVRDYYYVSKWITDADAYPAKADVTVPVYDNFKAIIKDLL